MYLSKTRARAMGCETHYAAYHAPDNNQSIEKVGVLALIGNDFHAFMAEYLLQCATAGVAQDPEWANGWIGTERPNPEAEELIRRAVDRWEIEPENVYGTEVYLSVDSDFKPLEEQIRAEPGRKTKKGAALGGTIDYVEMEGNRARLVDYKTSWVMTNTSEIEAAVYSFLVFCHFPHINMVDFVWYFPRLGQFRSVSYVRSGLYAEAIGTESYDEYLVQLVQGLIENQEQLEEKIGTGEPLTVDPYAGLCHYCSIKCPMLVAFQPSPGPTVPDEVQIPPLQTVADAQYAARLLYLMDITHTKLRKYLRGWIEEKGPISIDGEREMGVQVSTVRKYPVVPALSELGLGVVEDGNIQASQSACSLALQAIERIEGSLIKSAPDDVPGSSTKYQEEQLVVAKDFIKGAAAVLVPPTQEKTPSWDIPLNKLALSGMSGYLKAKKRTQLRDDLGGFARTFERTTVKAYRIDKSLDSFTDEGEDEHG